LNCQSKEQIKEAHGELEALKRFNDHPHIIKLIDHASLSTNANNSNHRQVYLLFPLFSRGTAWDAVDRADGHLLENSSLPWPFPEKKAIFIINCIAKALKHMHDKGYSHRDVKPHNILLSDEGNGNLTQPSSSSYRSVGFPILMDLGSVCKSRWDLSTKQQALAHQEEASTKTSAAYRAPEITSVSHILPTSIDERVDTWGLGCTLYCLAFGHSPFETAKEGVLRLAILNGRYHVPNENKMRECKYSDAFVDLIKVMLQLDYRQRPFTEEIIFVSESLLDS
jgi:serine/threonine kinase 16